MSNEEQQQADETVVRLLGRREHSAHELRQKLRQRGYADSIIKQSLATAQEHGWQSDERYAEIWLRQMLSSGNGWMKIKAAAGAKGITEELLQRLTDEAAPDWTELCYERLNRKFGEQPPETRQQRDKIMRHLQSRGFRFDEIKAALERQQQPE
ncbi:regulatory protein RecX [Pseudidiomarina terrestris]|uniref:Regulatory protein RecX n=1 Tax=Pseudidiomarina terrestris TaxID=2820060 RepID=A0AAW7QWN5_9GAMM|nr:MULTISPECIES: regulatory protein RecX [unclassified Pseudidiomarina]MDN7123867.1 regulatory protein RecX [Pseudidiomarina sp. 1APP75-32.1]MDN7127621.1 regulatory protein RecX [Pseudidiomarina sp. 1APR75-33.1]MDN7130367.1 regulatory protein RecX [Pseudidiomarina sp. 1APR75-15]MDN7136290.1 regulatory protein RecX [Pseudidiomarina sp. 1ASP75-5]MDN7138793.1 regulatory protein RecX [Pseudidiomarina sp. 1ASP75-14]